MSLPDSYRACVLDGPGDGWRLRSVPLERPGPGEILVRVLCCGFCLTDASVRKGTTLASVSVALAPSVSAAA